MKLNAEFGDLLYRVKGIVMHVGVYLGKNKVAHNSPDGNVQISSFDEYSENQPVKVVKTDFNNISLLEQRLKEMLSAGNSYNFLGFNCEQFATLLITGKSQSPQIKATVIGALTGFILGQAFSNKHSLWLTLAGATAGCIIANSTRQYDMTIDVNSASYGLNLSANV